MNPHWSVSQEHGPADVRTGKKILFVDDDKAWRDVVTVALQDAGYEIRTAKDASEAMLLTEGSNLGLIILDLDLGGEDGLMLMKFFKHNQPGVPIILYTGMKHDEDAILEMLRQGAQQYVRKGSLEDLLRAVQATVG